MKIGFSLEKVNYDGRMIFTFKNFHFLDGISVTPGPRQTTIIALELRTSSRGPDEVTTATNTSPLTGSDDSDDGFTVQTTPSSSSLSSTTRRGSVLFPRRPPVSSLGPLVRPGLQGVPRSTTLSTPLTAVPNIRKFQDIFSRRRSTTPPSNNPVKEDSKEEEGELSNDTATGVEEEATEEDLGGDSGAQKSTSGASGSSTAEPQGMWEKLSYT